MKNLQDKIILGISDSSVCGGAVLVRGGDVVAAVNEERLNREKMSTGFPEHSIRKVLDMEGLDAGDLDHVFAADEYNYFKPESRRWQGWLVDETGERKGLVYTLASSLASLVGSLKPAQDAYYALRRFLTADRRKKLPALLEDRLGIEAPLTFVDHHYCHALAAYYTAGHRDATVITLDGGGDGLCSRIYRVEDGHFELLHKVRSYDSIGNFYAYVTHLCGYTAHKHEGKITGLAARGEPVYADLLDDFITFESGTLKNTGNCYFRSAVRKLRSALPDDFDKEDLSASMQQVLEEHVVAYCDHWVRESGVGDVALAGGVFANVRLNQFIHELDSVDSIFVHPGMGDDGLAYGAALQPFADGEDDRGALSAGEPMADVYLGPEYSERRIEAALENAGLDYERDDCAEERVAELLADGMVVARYDGRMEYGPRALGNRSILYQPTDPSVNDWLNEKLDRTEFMPFAPAVAMENAGRCFQGVQGAEHTAEFMTVTFQCTEEMERLCPGVVHVDGSARPQLVKRETNPAYHEIISQYHRITGNPAIINTSFNRHEEPIVNTPEEAINGFLAAELDYLSMGKFLVKHPEGIKRRSEPSGEEEATRAAATG